MPKPSKLSKLETRLAHIDQMIAQLSRLQDEANSISGAVGRGGRAPACVPVLSVLNCEVYTKARTPLGHLKIVREKIAQAGEQDESKVDDVEIGVDGVPA
jgi:hypothetical protein